MKGTVDYWVLRKWNKDTSVIVSFFLTMLPWALDFKGAAAGENIAIQGAIAGVSGIFFLLFIYHTAGVKFSHFPLVFFAAIFLYAAVGFIGAFVYDEDKYAACTLLFSTLCYPFGAYIVYRALDAVKDTGKVYAALQLLTLIFVVSRIVVVFVLEHGINFNTARFEVLGPSTISAVGLVTLLLFSGMSRVNIISILMVCFLIIISVTRTYIVVAVAMVFLTVLAAPRRILHPRVLYSLVFGGGALVLALAAVSLAGLPLLDRWLYRMNDQNFRGYDPTLLTRTAEFVYVKQQIFSSVSTILFGNGIAAQTSLIGEDALKVFILVGEDSMRLHDIGFAHNNHATILFVAGFFGGGLLLVLQFWQALQGFILMNFASRNDSLPKYEKLIGIWGAAGIFGFLIYDLYSASFVDRGESMWYGITTGMMLWSFNRIGAHRVLARAASALKLRVTKG
jgi:hypothetical protein